mmetsp:Transcript_144329/g.462332  ORF Transcript_144329/g.462332 Transcript_144329/m.462332 type:complete len:485 (+) Transcript_144329:195-1649(+)
MVRVSSRDDLTDCGLARSGSDVPEALLAGQGDDSQRLLAAEEGDIGELRAIVEWSRSAAGPCTAGMGSVHASAFGVARAPSLLLLFALGFLAAAMLDGSRRSSLQASPLAAGPRGDASDAVAPNQEWLSTDEWRAVSDKPRAYVMMVYDVPNEQLGPFLWGAVALARSLNQFTAHRIVLLTNHKVFPGGEPLKERFAKLGVEVRKLQQLDMPSHTGLAQRAQVGFWKLQAWNLTDLERAVWLDVDSLVYRNMDWILDEREGMWAARDDWGCVGDVSKVHTSILALQPSSSDFQGLLVLAAEQPSLTVHEVIALYFAQRRVPIHLLSDLEAGFGRCLGSDVPSPYISPDGDKTNGLWSFPAFIHKSGGYASPEDGVNDNLCFSTHLSSQSYSLGDTGIAINVCQFHLVGEHWRALFCEATSEKFLRLTSPEIGGFCNDHCYFWGEGEGCTQVHRVEATPDFASYSVLQACQRAEDNKLIVPCRMP